MRIAVLLSGGVDSSVALHRLRALGEHELHAVYLKIWLEDELAHLGECPWEDDLSFARDVCETADVPLHVVSLQRKYHEIVVRDALAELRAGRTPSPDILCNRHIKFEAALEALKLVKNLEVDALASGHYARLRGGPLDPTDPEKVELLRGVDPVKDQTYFLHRLEREQLHRLLFPLGSATKQEIRQEADALALPNRDRPDSQGICFLGRIPFSAFVREHLGEAPGAVVDDATGRRIAEHRGHWFFTIGQRRGLGLSGGPWYVVAKDVERNEIRIAHGTRPEARRESAFGVREVHWISGEPALDGEDLLLRIRHGPLLLRGNWTARTEDGSVGTIRLAEPVEGLAAGQAAVLYRGEVCLGGGWIRGPEPS